MSGVIIVSGFQECGSAKLTGLLKAGGLRLAGGANEPSFELHAATPPPAVVIDDIFSVLPSILREHAHQFMPRQAGGGGTQEIDTLWWAGIHGEVVKIVYPHLLKIPHGDHKALWCDPVDERHRAVAVLSYGGGKPTNAMVDICNHYFVTRRDVARHALESAGARLLTVNQAETTSGPERCRAACNRIADFLGVTLDIEAMVERACAVPTGSMPTTGIVLDGPAARDRARAEIDGQPLGTRVLFLPPLRT